MKKLFTIVVLTFVLVGQINAQFRAGAALRVITPNPLLPVSGGIGVPKPSTEKKGDLFVRAVVFEKNGTKVAIVSVDNLGWPSVLGDQTRALVKGIPPQNILIGATHTHSAPDAYGFPDETGKSNADLNYLKKCVSLMAEAIQEAEKNLQPASLKIVVGEAKGKIAYNYYAPELYDPRCGVIQAIAESGPKKGQAIATLVNYAIHPEVIGSGRGILSPDLCGPLYDRIESQGGGMALFMNGAQGGMVTADTRAGEGKENNTWEECQRIGNLLGDEALRLIANAEVEKDPVLACSSSVVTFPIDSEIMRYILKNSPLKLKASPDNTVSTVVNYLKIGSARALTIPGEALPNVGYYVKRKMNAPKPFLFGLTNDAFGYMLTREDFNSFKRYEYVSRTSLGERTADIYVEEALKLVERNP
ncbi:hypothetical protein WBG78_27825 [Chryseolinea sp. T2]|uniref:hypothetical protein n=1 Tax=Chryseolinea sp. T2 TaxID=3129255 RepID=UPI003077E766